MQLVWEEGGRRYVASFRPVGEGLSASALRILRLLDTPKTLAELAAEIGTTPQAVFYHVKRLRKAGLVRVVGKGGRQAYVRTADAYGVVFRRREAIPSAPVPRAIHRFFSPLVEDGRWTATIVVGAPDPHGMYLQRARDGHYAGALGFFLGRYFSFSGFPVRVDTDMLTEWQMRDLLLLGGPVSNVVSLELVERRKAFFDLDRPWMILGRRGQYTDQNVGIIAKLNVGNHWYILLAGVSALGTKASVYALIHGWEELLPKYRDGEYYWIVAGLDRDGDGQIDMTEVLEHGTP